MKHARRDIDAVLVSIIARNPGMRFMELARAGGVNSGVLTYHLAALEGSKEIKVDRRTRVARYYPLNFPDGEAAILGCLRQEPTREIALLLLERHWCAFTEIVERAGRAPSTVSSHLKKMREAGVVSVRHAGRTRYGIADRDLVAKVLARYKSSLKVR